MLDFSIKCVCLIFCMCAKTLMQRQKDLLVILENLDPLVQIG
jgi:hypothetical protein